MAQPLDPYRTLGLAPGASLDEIRRAYRRLAKANHPDSAGEAALPRFLAIQAAYEMLTEGRGRLASGGRRPSTRAGRNADAGAAGADPARARTTSRDSRQRSGGGTATGGRGSARSAGSAAGGATGAAGAGAGPPGRERPPGQTRRPGTGRRSPNKATLGSTSYDAAEDEPFEPEWAGGTWYGASSGTYWTLNPKEYADPRKHGPEYQRRARRRLDGLEPEEADDDASFSGEAFGGPESETAAGGERRREGFDGRWTYPDETDEPPAREADDDTVWVRWSPDPDADTEAGPGGPTARPALDEIADRILAGRVGFAGRFVVAFFGWAPIAAVIAWLAGELSGCGRFTATCADPAGVWTTIPLLAVYGLLVAAPSIAGISAAGLVGSLAVAVPAAVILSAGGGSRQPEASSTVLTVLFFIGYVVGVVLAVARKRGWRRVPSA